MPKSNYDDSLFYDQNSRVVTLISKMPDSFGHAVIVFEGESQELGPWLYAYDFMNREEEGISSILKEQNNAIQNVLNDTIDAVIKTATNTENILNVAETVNQEYAESKDIQNITKEVAVKIGERIIQDNTQEIARNANRSSVAMGKSISGVYKNLYGGISGIVRASNPIPEHRYDETYVLPAGQYEARYLCSEDKTKSWLVPKEQIKDVELVLNRIRMDEQNPPLCAAHKFTQFGGTFNCLTWCLDKLRQIPVCKQDVEKVDTCLSCLMPWTPKTAVLRMNNEVSGSSSSCIIA